MTPEEKWLLAQEVRDDVLRQVRRRTDPDTAEDAVAEAVARSVAADVASRGEMFGWLLTTSRRVARDAAVKGRNRSDAERREAARSLPPPDPGDVVVDADESERETLRVLRVLRTLPERQRAALRMRLADDVPVEAVAAALGTSYKSAESLLSRARSTFRAAWPTAPVLAALAALRRGGRAAARPVVALSGAAVIATVLMPGTSRPPRVVTQAPDAARPVPRRLTPIGAAVPASIPTPPGASFTRLPRPTPDVPASLPIPTPTDPAPSTGEADDGFVEAIRRCLAHLREAPILGPSGQHGCPSRTTPTP